MTRRVFLHDGSFPGFLCAAAELLNAAGRDASARPTASGIAVRGPSALIDLFEEAEPVPRDDDRARSLWRRLEARVGAEAILPIMEAFLSDMSGADEAAALMMVRLWKEGAAALDDLADPNAALVEKAAFRTSRESHKFLGFVRFSELGDGSWYSRIEPECDILSLIADHFTRRFPGMRWAIHDGRRGSAVLHESGTDWIKVEGFSVGASDEGTGCTATELPLSETELALREVWKRYFTSVAIEARKNPRLQANFMPKKYWKNLPETQSPTTFPPAP